MEKLSEKFKRKLNEFFAEKINQENRERLHSEPFTLLTNNCIGGVIYHDLGLRFDSPTINLYLKDRDFIEFVINLEFYRKAELIEDTSQHAEFNFPVGILKGDSIHRDIRIYFQHYKSFGEAAQKWAERSLRIQSKILVIFELYNNKIDCESWNKIKYKKKCLMHEKIIGINDAIALQCYIGHENEYARILKYSGFTGHRFLEKEFDYVAFINESKVT